MKSYFNQFATFTTTALCAVALTFPHTASADWKVEKDTENDKKFVHVLHGDDKIATLVYGDEELKPYLQIYGSEGEPITKGDGGRYPHHKGIFIGWNQIRTDLGSADVWHGRNGSMRLTSVDKAETTANGVTITATVEWHQGDTPEGPDTLLITETRTQNITRTAEGDTLVDFQTTIKAERDLRLDGDLQHAGVHYRAPQSVFDHEDEVRYEFVPEGKTKGDDLKWVRFTFPVDDNWYSTLQLNAPSNPVEELSMRNYGRFGYFFKKELEAEEELSLHYRFYIREVEGPDAELTELSQALYDAFADE